LTLALRRERIEFLAVKGGKGLFEEGGENDQAGRKKGRSKDSQPEISSGNKVNGDKKGQRGGSERSKSLTITKKRK